MTLEEKIGQLVQYNASQAPATSPTTAALNVNPPGPDGIDSYKLAESGKLGSMLNTVGQQLTNHFQHAAVDRNRLQIPLLFGADVISRIPHDLPRASGHRLQLESRADFLACAHGRHRSQNGRRQLVLLAHG